MVAGLQEIYGNLKIPLHKWASSDPSLIPTKENETEVRFADRDELGVKQDYKALGIHWCTASDEFTFKHGIEIPQSLTMRNTLALYMSPFDPKMKPTTGSFTFCESMVLPTPTSTRAIDPSTPTFQPLAF